MSIMILPIYEGSNYKFFNCEICSCKFNDFNHLIQHYKNFKNHKNYINFLKNKLIRESLSLECLSLNYIKCEICNEVLDNDSHELYLIHLIEYHNSCVILELVKDLEVLEYLELSSNQLLLFKCEICNEENYMDGNECREAYKRHILLEHKDKMIDYKIAFYVKDYKVLSYLLLNTLTKTKIDEEYKQPSLFSELSYQDDNFFKEIYNNQLKEISERILKCELCQEAIENSVEVYLNHILENHNIHSVLKFSSIEKIKEILKQMGSVDIICEVCGEKIDFSNKYTDHVVKRHFELGANLIRFVKDIYIFTQTLREILKKKSLKRIDSQIRSNISSNALILPKFIIDVNIKRRCDICNEEIEPDYENYAVHLTSHTSEETKYKVKIPNVLSILLYGVTSVIKCEICGKFISENLKDYIYHLSEFHISQSSQFTIFIKDGYIRSVLGSEKSNSNSNSNLSIESDKKDLSVAQISDDYESYSKNYSSSNDYISSKDKESIIKDKLEKLKFLDESLHSDKIKELGDEIKNINKEHINKISSLSDIQLLNIFPDNEYILKQKFDQIEKLKSLEDSLFSEKINELSEEIKNLLSNKSSDDPDTSEQNSSISTLEFSVESVKYNSNEFRLVQSNFMLNQLLENTKIINIFSLINDYHLNLYVETIKKFSAKEKFLICKINDDKFKVNINLPNNKVEFIFDKEYLKFSKSIDSILNFSFESGLDSKFLILSSVVLKEESYEIDIDEFVIADRSLFFPSYIIEFY